MISLIVIIAFTVGLFIGRFLAHRDIVRKGRFEFKGKYYGMEQE